MFTVPAKSPFSTGFVPPCISQSPTSTVFKVVLRAGVHVCCKASGKLILGSGQSLHKYAALGPLREGCILAALEQVGVLCSARPADLGVLSLSTLAHNIVDLSLPSLSGGLPQAYAVCSHWVDGGVIKLDGTDRHGLSKDNRLQYLMSLLKGAAELHHHGLAHRDLKPHNVLCSRASNGHCEAVFIDFEAACVRACRRDGDSVRHGSPVSGQGAELCYAIEERWAKGIPLQHRDQPSAPAPEVGGNMPLSGRSAKSLQAVASGTNASLTTPVVDVFTVNRRHGIRGGRGTPLWRGQGKGSDDPFQIDLTALAAMTVCVCMNQTVTRRHELFYKDPRGDACELPVKSFLESGYASEKDAPPHTLVATVRAGLRCEWDRRKASPSSPSHKQWEPRRDSSSSAPDIIEWDRSDAVADAVVSFLTVTKRRARRSVCKFVFEQMSQAFLSSGEWCSDLPA